MSGTHYDLEDLYPRATNVPAALRGIIAIEAMRLGKVSPGEQLSIKFADHGFGLTLIRSHAGWLVQHTELFDTPTTRHPHSTWTDFARLTAHIIPDEDLRGTFQYAGHANHGPDYVSPVME